MWTGYAHLLYLTICATWLTYFANSIEIILLIVCGSIPALKPLYAICLGKKPMTTSQRYMHGATVASMKPNTRKSYTKHINNDEQDSTYALAHVSSPGSATRGGASEDEIGLAKETEFSNSDGKIHVTRTFQVDS
jgi:hypothetical protein